MRKKLVALLLIVAPVFAACRASAPMVAGQGGGAATPRAAVEQFLAAARAQDIRATSLIWGTKDGPASVTVASDKLERQVVTMHCFLRHDRHVVIDETPVLEGQRRFTIDLTAGTITRRTNLVAVPATAGGWYVLSADLEPLRDICANRQ
jgi:hypothetical protein